MRILVISRHFPPDLGGQVQGPICRGIAAGGHQVDVITSFPFYNDAAYPSVPARERLDGANVFRMCLLPERKRFAILRLVNYSLFFLGAFLFAAWRRRRYEAILFYPNPPLLAPLAVLVTAWICRLPFIYHCQDIHPEIMGAVGWTRIGSLSYRFGLWIDRLVCDRAWKIVVLSQDMVVPLAARGLPAEKIAIINNPAVAVCIDGEIADPLAGIPCDHFVVLFAGNAGAFQGLEVVIDAALALRDRPEIQFVFLGGGSRWRQLKERAGDCLGRTVLFIDYVPPASAAVAIRRADVGIISLRPGIVRLAYPSKTMAYLQQGCPILALVEPDCDLARDIVESRLGMVVDVNVGAEQVVKALCSFQAEQSAWRQGRDRIKSYCTSNHGEVVTTQRWNRLLAGVGDGLRSNHA